VSGVRCQETVEYIDLPAFENLESQTEELGRILNGLINRFQPSIEKIS